MINSVLLIRPRAIGKLEFPFGLLYVGTALKNKGYSVEILDMQAADYDDDDVIDKIAKTQDLIVGINALAPHYRWVKEFTKKLKEKSPATKIVIGGHIAPLYEILLQKTGVDFVCLGEGEDFFPELIEGINKKEDMETVRGMAFKREEKIIKTKWRPYVESFLIPNYDLIDFDKYLIHPTKDFFFKYSPEYRKREKEDDKLGVIMFSRGCVGGCGFCYIHLPGFRQGSIEWSWEHLKLLHDKYGVKYFRVDDELFTNNFEWFKEIYKKIKESKIDILFRITGLRVDSINDLLLKMLKDMGCIAVNYGIESGSQKILDNMNKRTKVEQNLSAIKKTLDAGMQTMAYIIVGYEGEDERTLEETSSILLESKLPPEYISIFYAVPLPGTKMYKDCLDGGKIKNEEDYLLSIAPYIEERRKAQDYYFINLTKLSKEYLVKWVEKMLILSKYNHIFKNYPRIFKFIKSIRIPVAIDRYLVKVVNKLHVNYKKIIKNKR